MAKSLTICECQVEFQMLTSHYFYLSFFASYKKKYPVENLRKNEDGSYSMHWFYGVLLSSYINHSTISYCLLTLNWTDIFDVVPLLISICQILLWNFHFATSVLVVIIIILFIDFFFLFINLLNQKALKSNYPTTNILYLTLHPPL